MFNLRKLVQGVGAQINPFDGGQTFSSVNAQPQQPQLNQPMQPVPSAQRASFTNTQQTLNPVSNTLDVGLQTAYLQPKYPTPMQGYEQQAAIYNQNPMDPRVTHMDPKYFGYPADNAIQQPQHQNPLDHFKRLLGL